MNECVKIIMNVKKCIKLTHKWIIERQIPSFGPCFQKINIGFLFLIIFFNTNVYPVETIGKCKHSPWQIFLRPFNFSDSPIDLVLRKC